VDSLKRFGEADLQSLIHTVTYLIRGAILRPKGSGEVSQDICPLGELIDMYHTHEATLRHDKVYALLGMSSDDARKANLSPDYIVPWKDLFERLIRFLLCKQISVEASPNQSIAFIKSPGWIVGKVSSVRSDITWNNRQGVDVVLKNISGKSGYDGKLNSHWTLQTSAKSIRIGDFIYLLQGAFKPMVIRLCEGYFTIILIAATPPQTIRTESKDIAWSKYLQLVNFLSIRNFLFVWNWENSLKKLQGLGEYEEFEGYWDKLKRLWNFVLILGDEKVYKKAEETFQEIMEGYEARFGKESLYETVADQLFLRNDADLDLMNSQYSRPPLL
jgi:hypothetical protein